MKKIALFLLLIVLAAGSFSQPATSPSATVQNNLLQKSKRQNTAAWLLMAGGGVLFTAGLAVYPKDYYWIFNENPENLKRANTASVLVISGIACMAVSVPLFIISSSNKKKANAASLGFRMETTPVIQQRSFVQSSYPSLSLKISL